MFLAEQASEVEVAVEATSDDRPASPSDDARLDELATLPQLRDCFARGRLSEGTVDTLARVATPDNEDRLLDTAAVATGAQLQTLVRDHRRIAADGDDVPAARSVPDTFGFHIDERGQYRWRGSSAPSWVRRSWPPSTRPAVATSTTPDLALNRSATARPWPGWRQQYLATAADVEGCLPERFLTIVQVRDDQPFLQDGGALDLAVADQFACGSWLTSVTTRDGQPITATARTRLATRLRSGR